MLSLSGGIGYQVDATENQIPDYKRTDFGYSGGYNLYWGKPTGWTLNSSILYADTRYPGITQGIFNQIHMVGRNLGKVYIGINYLSNTSTQNSLRDTLFNSDYLVINTSKYGVNVNYATIKSNSSFGTGNISQSGGVVHSRNNGWYFDLSHNQALGSYQNLTATVHSAMSYVGKRDIFLALNSTVRLSTRHISFMGMYNRIPLIQDDNLGLVRSIETVNGGPSVNFNLFNSTIAGSFRYNFSKTISESAIRHGIGSQINYNSSKAGLNVTASGFMPLRDPGNWEIPVGETKYASVTLTKHINVPYKKLNVSDVTIRLFKDLNNSGRYEPGDSLFTGLSLSFGEKILITDDKGEIHYRNVRPGGYSLNLLNSNTGNYVANGGGMHKVLVQNEDVVMDVPFRKGKKISGSIKIDRDTLGTVNLTPDNFRILITDTSGHTVLSITDRDGNFESFVSEGIYTVALPAEYFTGSDFKPVQISYTADLTKEEEASVTFTIKQKKRVVRFLDADKK